MSLAGMMCLGLVAAANPVSLATPRSMDGIEANDNRSPAGQLRDDTLSIALEVRMGTWHPEADSGPAIEVAAFAEAGKAPQVPGPLIRVKEGTTIAATIRNALP
ncbi:MAG TPA: hypothetical protein VL853_10625, partial [Gemmatimonadales bacterium]|nr:hypothetical protein [Gemmatimonadales bacterium]